jgi:hypothetical protein
VDYPTFSYIALFTMNSTFLELKHLSSAIFNAELYHLKYTYTVETDR